LTRQFTRVLLPFDILLFIEELSMDRDTTGPKSRGPGRPKLGVVAREVTLLPQHWEWLAKQNGGASVALRRLIDDAQRGSERRA
jgi:hypothetical protein